MTILAAILLILGACLLLASLLTYVGSEQSSSSGFGELKATGLESRLESRALLSSLLSYGFNCVASGLLLLFLSYSGRVLVDLARVNRLQAQQNQEMLVHLAELNPRYEERVRREQEAEQRRAEADREAARRKAEKERLDQEALARWRAESERPDHDLLAENREKVLATESERKQGGRTSRKAEKVAIGVVVGIAGIVALVLYLMNLASWNDLATSRNTETTQNEAARLPIAADEPKATQPKAEQPKPPALHSARAQSALRSGQNLEKMGKINGAVGFYRQVLKEFPDSPEAKIASDRLKNLAEK